MPNNILIGYGLMLQGRIKEAIEVFRKEHDSCLAKLKEKNKKNVLPDLHILKDILVAEGYLLWALGMGFWAKEKRGKAEESFRDSYEALNKAYENHKNEPMPFLVEHLLTELRKGTNALGMDLQLRFINEWEEKHKQELESESKQEAGPEQPSQVGLTKEVLEKVTSIENRIKKFIEPEVKKEISKAEAISKYEVYLPKQGGFGSQIIRCNDTDVKNRFLDKRNDFDVFIYGRSVYVKKMNEKTKKKELIFEKVQERAYKLLVMFLKYKDKSLHVRALFKKAWADVDRETTGIPEDKDITNKYLKFPISNIRDLIYPHNWDIVTQRNSSAFISRGSLNYCVIIEKTEKEKFTISD